MSVKQVGLIGYPVAHSLSPAMQQVAFDTLSISARYTLWETPPGALVQRIEMLRAPQMLGANVTIPYKERVVSLLDECDQQAERIGAVNTIVNRAGRLVGYNTDAPGFLRALHEGMAQLPGSQLKNVVILGTGGAARGAAVALLEHGIASLTLLGRTAAHMQVLLEHLRLLAAAMDRAPRINGALLGDAVISEGGQSQQALMYNMLQSGEDETTRFLSSADVLVNATSVGLKAGDRDTTRLLIDVNALPATTLVMDMIFNPPQTALLRATSARGCATLNGLSMLLYQGALAFELWTGRAAPLAVMRTALGLPL